MLLLCSLTLDTAVIELFAWLLTTTMISLLAVDDIATSLDSLEELSLGSELCSGVELMAATELSVAAELIAGSELRTASELCVAAVELCVDIELCVFSSLLPTQADSAVAALHIISVRQIIGHSKLKVLD